MRAHLSLLSLLLMTLKAAHAFAPTTARALPPTSAATRTLPLASSPAASSSALHVSGLLARFRPTPPPPKPTLISLLVRSRSARLALKATTCALIFAAMLCLRSLSKMPPNRLRYHARKFRNNPVSKYGRFLRELAFENPEFRWLRRISDCLRITNYHQREQAAKLVELEAKCQQLQAQLNAKAAREKNPREVERLMNQIAMLRKSYGTLRPDREVIEHLNELYDHERGDEDVFGDMERTAWQ